jgi:hypothetical protein
MPAADVLITPVTIWRSSVGVARPYEDVAYGANWAGWAKLGLTSAALTVNLERTKTDKIVQQALGKIGSVITNEVLTISTTLAEMTMDNLALSWPGIVSKEPAAAGQAAYERLQGGGKICLNTLQWGFEGLYQDEECAVQLPLRFFCIGEAEMGGEIAFDKENQTGIPFQVSASYELEQPPGKQLYEWFKVTAPAL